MSAPDNGPLAQVTAADVLRWGRAQPADEVIGVCRNARACLIATYAAEVVGSVTTVFPGGPGTILEHGYYACFSGEYPLPDDLNHLARGFDALRVTKRGKVLRWAMHPADLDRLEVTP